MRNNSQQPPYGYGGQQQQQAAPQTTGYSGGPQTSSPYVQSTPIPASGATGTGGRSMDFLNKIGQQAEGIAGNVWNHLKVGNSMSDSAWGKMSHGSNLLTARGFEGLYKQHFGLAPNEQLLKTYACYLSASTGPIPGTLYVTNQKFAFCSDRPISYAPTPGQQASSHYKVVLPLEKVQEVSPSENQNKPHEKYILVLMVDGHEFWFMGFMNYDKGLKNMREALSTRGGGQRTSAAPQSAGGLYSPGSGQQQQQQQQMNPNAQQGSGASYPNVYSNQASGQYQGGQPPYVPSQGANQMPGGQNQMPPAQSRVGNQYT
ncbi:unnamed protein product [Sphagnum balticum]